MNLDTAFKLGIALLLILLVWTLVGCASGARAISGAVPSPLDRRCDYIQALRTNVAIDVEASDAWRALAELAADVWAEECTL